MPKPINEAPEIRAIADKVRAMMADGQVDMTSAVQIIRAAAAVGASWDAVEDVITEIAKGADGVSGTADDLIPQATLNMLVALLHSGVVRDMVAWAAEMSPAVAAGCLGHLNRWKCW